MATIANLVTVIEAQMKGFENVSVQLEKTATQMEGVASLATTMGAAIIGAFSIQAVAAFAEEMLSFASDMEDMSAQTGVGVEKLQELNYVAAGTNLTVQDLATGMAKLSKNIVEGNTGAASALEKLHINAKTFIGLSFDEQLLIIADALQKISSPAEQNTIAIELFGKAGAKWLPFLKENIAGLSEEARNNGSVMSSEIIEKSDAVDDAWSRLIIRGKALAFTFGVELIEALKTTNQSMSESTITADAMGTNIKAITAENDGLDGALGKVKGGILGVKQEVPDLTMSMKELTSVERMLTNQVQDSIKAHEDHAKALKATLDAADKAGKAMNDYYMHAMQMEEQWRQESIKATEEAGAALNAYMMKAIEVDAAVNAELLKNAQAWEEWETAVHDDMARNEHSMLKHVVTMSELWNRFNEDLHDNSVSFTGAILNLYDGMAGKLTSLFNNTFSGSGLLGGILQKGMSFLLGPAGPLSGLITAGLQKLGDLAIAGAKKIWDGILSIFGTDEEARKVNPARDAFLLKFGPSGTGPGSGFQTLAGILTDITGEAGGGHLFDLLTHADTMAKFTEAINQIVDLLRANDRLPSGFAGGTHGDYLDFGAGTQVTLHGRERVMTEAEGRAEAGGWSSVASGVHALRSDMARFNEGMRRMIRDEMAIARGRA